MANVKISQLPTATSLSIGDLVPVVQGGITKQATPDLLPLSTAVVAALAAKADTTAIPTQPADIGAEPAGTAAAQIAALVGAAPDALNTLKEIDDQIAADEGSAAALAALVATKADAASVAATYVPFGPASPNPAVNTSWLDSTTSPPTLKGWNGTAWVAIGGSSGAAAIDNGDGTITFSTGTPTLSNTTLPAITGTAAVGNTLTASTGAWSTTPDSYTYQWFRNGSAISGATASTYMLVSADASTSITIAVTATKASYTSSTATSAAASVAALALSNTVAPTITGTAQTGQVLSVSNGTWNATPDSYTYQWQRAGGAIPGATASTYTLVVGDVSQAITCIVSATKAGYTSASATSNIVTPSAPGATITTTDNGDGTFSTTGSAVTDNGDGTYTATGSAVTDNGDGTYTLAA